MNALQPDMFPSRRAAAAACLLTLALLLAVTTGCATRQAPARLIQNPLQIDASEYDRLFQASLDILKERGYRIDRQNHRFGDISTFTLDAPTAFEPWHNRHHDTRQTLGSTLNHQRRRIVIKLRPETNEEARAAALRQLQQQQQREQQQQQEQAQQQQAQPAADAPATTTAAAAAPSPLPIHDGLFTEADLARLAAAKAAAQPAAPQPDTQSVTQSTTQPAAAQPAQPDSAAVTTTTTAARVTTTAAAVSALDVPPGYVFEIRVDLEQVEAPLRHLTGSTAPGRMFRDDRAPTVAQARQGIGENHWRTVGRDHDMEQQLAADILRRSVQLARKPY